MQTVETVNTRETTVRMVKILDSNYVKVDLEWVANNTTQMNTEYKT